MIEIPKERFEMQVVASLLRAMPHLRVGACRPSPLPEVDVLMSHADGGDIAIEVTRLHPSGGEERRRWEGARESIVSRAVAQYERFGLPGLDVVIFWSEWTDPQPEQTATSRELAAFVRDHVPKPGESAAFDSASDDHVALPRAIDAIELRHLGQGENTWRAHYAACPPDLTVALIRDRINVKNHKALHYKGSYRERWLALAVGAEGPSTWGIVRREIVTAEFTSHFQRVFLVVPPIQATELRIARAV